LPGWLDYLGFIADTAKSLGLGVGLKNSQVLLQANPQIIDKFDWAVNEGEQRACLFRFVWRVQGLVASGKQSSPHDFRRGKTRHPLAFWEKAWGLQQDASSR
jgi:hypothetical protein